jgi:predicted transcriptional regulator
MFAAMRLADFLADREMSQAEFGKRIGATQAAVSRYADGSRMPRREHLSRIRKATGGVVTADDFLSHGTSPQRTRRSS